MENMGIEIRDIRKKDYKKAIGFAIKGMHFDWYVDSAFARNAYGRYFWYLEINRATQVFAAYNGDEFLGVLLAEIKGEKRKNNNILQKCYIMLFELMVKLFFKEGVGVYEQTTEEQLAHYLKSHKPDGEIVFLAADPKSDIKGIGTALLNALAEKEKGKTVYLYTDSACTYEFYDHRGFERAEEKEIVMKLPKGDVNLNCFVYSKTL